MRFEWRHQYDDARDAYEADVSAIDTSIPPDNDKMKIAPDPIQPVQKSQARDADINEIIRRAGINDGSVPLPMDQSFYEKPATDFGPEITLKEVLDIQRQAREHFMALPAKTRAFFGNRPEALHDFVNNPANAEKAVELGLLRKVESKPSDADRIVEAVNKIAPPAPPATPKTP